VQSVDIANTKHNGKYIFAGFATKSATPPFVLDAAHTAVTPNDDTHSIQLNISPGQTMTTNFIGRAIFAPLFQALIDARDALLSNNAANIQPTITSLQTAMDPVTTALTTNGARQRQLQVTIDTMESSKIQLKSLLSSKEDVNMAEAISQLANQETTYQSVIEVSQRAINTINLFDVLR
jgi:flagellin-like hook-associated protein FlgL